MSLPVSVGAIALCIAATRAMADRAVDVEMVNGGRFVAPELIAALRVRIAPTGRPVKLAVISLGDGDQVIVEVDHVRRTVTIGDRSGEDAARLIALVASDLVLADLATVPPVPMPARWTRWTIGAFGTIAAWDHAHAGGELELTIPRGHWLALVAIGGGTSIGGAVRVDSEVARVGIGRRFGWLDLGVHATVVPIEVPTGAGDVTALVGGGAIARVRLPITAAAALVIAAGVDAFATQTQYALGPTHVAETTPWLAPWLAAGVELEP